MGHHAYPRISFLGRNAKKVNWNHKRFTDENKGCKGFLCRPGGNFVTVEVIMEEGTYGLEDATLTEEKCP